MTKNESNCPRVGANEDSKIIALSPSKQERDSKSRRRVELKKKPKLNPNSKSILIKI